MGIMRHYGCSDFIIAKFVHMYAILYHYQIVFVDYSYHWLCLSCLLLGNAPVMNMAQKNISCFNKGQQVMAKTWATLASAALSSASSLRRLAISMVRLRRSSSRRDTVCFCSVSRARSFASSSATAAAGTWLALAAVCRDASESPTQVAIARTSTCFNSVASACTCADCPRFRDAATQRAVRWSKYRYYSYVSEVISSCVTCGL